VNKLCFIKENILGIAPEIRQSRDTVTHGDIDDSFADRIHNTEDGITWHKGYLRQKRSIANPGGNVVLTYGRGQDFNPRLTGRWWAQVILNDLENFRGASSGYDDAFVFHGFFLFQLKCSSFL
jgi:hypothetical protein